MKQKKKTPKVLKEESKVFDSANHELNKIKHAH